jgi:5'-3' exonuclease
MIVLVDMGYLLFYRLHATSRWMTFQNEFKNRTLEDEIVLEYFEKHLTSQLDKLRKKYKPGNAFIFCKDERHAKVWRKELYTEYKATRGEATSLIRKAQDVFHRIVQTYGEIFAGDGLEADDVAYLMVKRIRQDLPTEPLVIITSDRDYLQMKDEHMIIVDGTGKEMKGCGDATKDKLAKILMGDVSDNIPAVCKGCGKKTAMSLVQDMDVMESYLVKNNCKDVFLRNETLICMQRIPKKLADDFYEQAETRIKTLIQSEKHQ